MPVCVGCGLTEQNNVISVDLATNSDLACDSADGLFVSLARSSGGDFIITSETTNSTAYTDLATVGPTVTITTRDKALILFDAVHAQSGGSGSGRMSVAVSGATTIAASDDFSLDNTTLVLFGLGYGFLLTGLTAGTNIFRAKYRTAEAGDAVFSHRRLTVAAL